MAPRVAFTSEDFAFMLQRVPGAYLWLGQGRAWNREHCHHDRQSDLHGPSGSAPDHA